MSIQSTFNQGLAITAGLISMNPQIKERIEKKQIINKATKDQKSAGKLINQAQVQGNFEVMKEQGKRHLAASKAKAEADPEKYGEDYIQQAADFDYTFGSGLTEKELAAFKSVENTSQTKSDIMTGVDQREQILRKKGSMRQQMKAEGKTSKEINEAYANGEWKNYYDRKRRDE